MSLLTSGAFWGTLGTIVVIGAMYWANPHSFSSGLGTATFVMAFWWMMSARTAQINRHVTERQIEELHREVAELKEKQ